MTKFSDLLHPINIRWPSRGDRLFPNIIASEKSAVLHPDALSRWAFLVPGYKTAADALADIAIAEKLKRHELIYPILFCYRQYIELSMKQQIVQFGKSVGACVPQSRGLDHNLREILRCYRRMLLAFDLKRESEFWQEVVIASKCILEFHAIDRRSFHFRYVTPVREETAYPIPRGSIDLGRVRDVMDGIDSFFTVSNEWLFSTSAE